MLILASSVISFYHCKPPAQFEMSRTAYILGSNDIVKISSDKQIENVPEKVLKAAVIIATFRDSGDIKFCSGTAIVPERNGENARIVTNHHCFADKKDGQVSELLIAEACTKTKAYFGFNGANGYKTHEIGCTAGTLKTDPTGDLGVFVLDDELPEGVEPLEIWTEDIVPNDREALIVHHPNIKGHFVQLANREFSLPAASITNVDCKTLGRFPKQEWKLADVVQLSVRHTCDLEEGSSGSALIDKESTKIIGVNWGGLTVKYSGETRKDNAATMASYLIGFLDGETDKVATALASDESMKGAAVAAAGTADASRENASSSSKKTTKAAKSSGGCGTLSAAEGKSAIWFVLALALAFPFANVILQKQQ